MAQSLTCTCVVAGGGPAGMMAGYLLARAGVDVVVLEKHADFLRDFRGDTIHPSTMEVLAELGLLERFLALPHQAVKYVEGEFGDERVRVADFTHLPTRCKFIAFMPQWDFLDFLAREAKRFATTVLWIPRPPVIAKPKLAYRSPGMCRAVKRITGNRPLKQVEGL